MISDIFSACACSVAALATLKNKTPKTVTVTNTSGVSKTVNVDYDFSSSIILCKSNDYYAYAVNSEDGFSIIFNDNHFNVISETPELITMIYSSVVKLMNDTQGVELHLFENEEIQNDTIPIAK